MKQIFKFKALILGLSITSIYLCGYTQIPPIQTNDIISITGPNMVPYIMQGGNQISSKDEYEQTFEMECYNIGNNVIVTYTTNENSTININDLTTGKLQSSMTVAPDTDGNIAFDGIGNGVYAVSLTNESGKRITKKLIIK